MLAQACDGIAPGDDRPFRVTANVQSYTYATAVGLHLTAAGRVHGTLAFGTTRDAELDARTLDLALEGGTRLRFGPGGRLHACPNLAVSLALGPSDFLLSETDLRYFGTGIGLGVAAIAFRSRRITVVPTAGVRAARVWVTLDPSSAERAAGVVGWTRSDAYWILAGNVTFVWNHRLSLRPTVSVPLGLVDSRSPFALVVPFGREDHEVSLGVALGYSIGRPRRPTR